MDELIFVKLGGSLLTDKTRPEGLRAEVLARLAAEVASALRQRPDLRLVLGHGSGSFGHMVASRYRTRDGVRTREEWRGYAETAHSAAALNYLVIEALWEAGVPALRVQPSASAHCRDGALLALDERPIAAGLAHGLVPVVHGDVALDDVRGGTIISTEQILAWLAPRLNPQRVVLVGEVSGVFTADPTRDPAARLIPEIRPEMLPELTRILGGSRGVDVTGGMVTKVQEMLALLETTPALRQVQIISGLVPGLMQAVMVDPALEAGTRLLPAGPRPQ